MGKVEFEKRKREIKVLSQSKEFLAYTCAMDLVEQLFGEEEYQKIVEIYESDFIKDKEKLWTFETAYSLENQGKSEPAERIYRYILSEETGNVAALNNLSNILETKKDFDEAFTFIKRAYKLDHEDEAVRNNFERLQKIIQEKKETEQHYQNSLASLQSENDFVISKLKLFIHGFKTEKPNSDGHLAVPKWKFKVMMKTNEQIAMSLLDQWLDKGYLRKTDERGEHLETVYEINPYLEEQLKQLKNTKMPTKWIDGLEDLTVEALDEFNYFDLVTRLNKIRVKYRKLALRDFNELSLNFILGNEKAIIILAGSLAEILLIYYCEKKKISEIKYQRQGKSVYRKLYDADLGDLLNYFEQNNILSNTELHLGNLSRIYRNFIHPGKELRETEELDQNKAQLCFRSVAEIIKVICK